MIKNYLIAFALMLFNFGFAQSVFINELHYDNSGADQNEGVEIAGPAGTDLSTYKIELYNGADGTVYATMNLSGVIPNQQNNFGTIWFAHAGIQNGPDGLALINGITVIQFLSYEGSFVATAGTANGMTSTNLPVSESTATAVGSSLQLEGTGQNYTDFSWGGPRASSQDLVNQFETFSATLAVNKENEVFFSVFPNPVRNGILTIQSQSNTLKNISIYDVIGKQVYQKSTTSNQINIGNLKTGLYFVRVQQDGKVAAKKLVVE